MHRWWISSYSTRTCCGHSRKFIIAIRYIHKALNYHRVRLSEMNTQHTRASSTDNQHQNIYFSLHKSQLWLTPCPQNTPIYYFIIRNVVGGDVTAHISSSKEPRTRTAHCSWFSQIRWYLEARRHTDTALTYACAHSIVHWISCTSMRATSTECSRAVASCCLAHSCYNYMPACVCVISFSRAISIVYLVARVWVRVVELLTWNERPKWFSLFPSAKTCRRFSTRP